MRLLLVVIMAFMAFGPLAGAAQDGTPTAGEAGDGGGLTRTNTRYVAPFTPDGLNSGLTVASSVEGACTFDSSIAIGRPDAWGCVAEGGVLDPCFENAFVALDEAAELVCLDGPWSTDVVMLTVTAPLSREKEAPDDAMAGAEDTAEELIEPWDLPWALELANGDRCSLLRGTSIVLAGQVVHYGCEQGGMILGETDRSQPVWAVSYLAEGDVATNLVEVLSAWT